MNLLQFAYIANFYPMHGHPLNRIECFNESCILASACLLPLYTDAVVDPEFKNYAGYAFIGIFVFNAFINTIFLVIEESRAVYFAIKKLIYKAK